MNEDYLRFLQQAQMQENKEITPWEQLQTVARKWIYRPDFMALRVCLATVKALDFETRPVWLMLIGPSSSAKSAFYLHSCTGFTPHVKMDDLSVAGILPAGRSSNGGVGVLPTLGKLGLWIINDFSMLLNANEERRNAVFGAWRVIYDGHFDRNFHGGRVEWNGRVHVILNCTPSIERFTRVQADLGERFLQIRIEKAEYSSDLTRKLNEQKGYWDDFQDEVLQAAKATLKFGKIVPETPFDIQCEIGSWSNFISMGRVATSRNYKDEITDVGFEEGCGRALQQLLSLATADAMNMGQGAVTREQVGMIRRVAYDSLPWARRAVLSVFPAEGDIKKSDLKEMAQIDHPYTFDRTMEELEAIGAITILTDLGNKRYTAKDKFRPFLFPVENKDSSTN